MPDEPVVNEERWTEQTETLVARELANWHDHTERVGDTYDDPPVPPSAVKAFRAGYHVRARNLLAALADAGLLVTPGGEVREQVRCSTAERESYVRDDSRVWWERGECVLADGHDGDHQTSAGTRWKWVPGGGMALNSTSAPTPWREVSP